MVPHILSNLIFFLHLLAYEILMCQAYTIKKFELLRLRLKGTPSLASFVEPLDFVKFCLSFTFTYSENFITLA